MRLPIGDAGGEDRAKQFVRADARVEGRDEPLDHRLVDPGLGLDPGPGGGAPI